MWGLSVFQGALIVSSRMIVLQPFERLFTPLTSRLRAASGINSTYELLNYCCVAQHRLMLVTKIAAAASAAVASTSLPCIVSAQIFVSHV
jgi:hypothetical protein